MKTEVVGKKSVFNLYVETLKEQEARGDRLMKLGYFTVIDLAKAMGWGIDKTNGVLRRGKFHREKCVDPRSGHVVVFYLPKK